MQGRYRFKEVVPVSIHSDIKLLVHVSHTGQVCPLPFWIGAFMRHCVATLMDKETEFEVSLFVPMRVEMLDEKWVRGRERIGVRSHNF